MDKATNLLGRQFLIAYWFPVFIVSVIAIMVRVYIYGWKAALDWWQQDLMLTEKFTGFYAQIWFIAGALITITFFAYLLRPLTRLIIQFYEGYWPSPLQEWFTALPVLGEKSIWNKKRVQQNNALTEGAQKQYSRLQEQLFYGYSSEENIMPTSLGNAMKAAEDYSRTVYGMDSVFWWPRLWPLLPDVIRNEVEESLVPIVALLNLAWLIAVTAILGAIYLELKSFVFYALAVLLGGLFLSFISYKLAVTQTKTSYGVNIRTSIDLYRFDLLKALHQPLPDNPKDEKELWNKLLSWIYMSDPVFAADIKYNHEKCTDSKSVTRKDLENQ